MTGQGINFMPRVLKGFCRILQIKYLRTVTYHPQTDDLVERFNKILKGMLTTATQGDPREWDQLLIPILFAIWEVPQASMGFSTFKLVYGYQLRGLHMVCEGWEGQEAKMEILPNYLSRLQTVWQLTQENLQKAQGCQKISIWSESRRKRICCGGKSPTSVTGPDSKLLTRWQGTYEVSQRIGPVDYEVLWSGGKWEKQLYCIKLLKEWKEQEGWMMDPDPDPLELGPTTGSNVRIPEGNTPLMDGHLMKKQKNQLVQLIVEFQDVFQDEPGLV